MKKLKFLLVLVLSLSLFTSFQVKNASASTQFTDVDDNYWALEEIQYLTNYEIINGYEDGTFKPEATLKRIHIALMLDRYFNYSYDNDQYRKLADIKEDDVNYEVIQAVVSNGLFDNIIKDNKFEPYKTATRAEMASILAKAFELEATSTSNIADVPNNHWAKQSIQALVDHNITVLYSENKFNPNGELKRSQFTAFMARVMHDYFLPVSKEVSGTDLFFWSNWEGIYKTAIDTDETVALHPTSSFGDIFVEGDWIYFLDDTYRTDRYGDAVKGYIYKMKKDGSKKKKLSNDIATSLTLVNGKLIYSYYGKLDKEGYTNNDQDGIKSMNLDGSNSKFINDSRSFTVTSNDEWVIFLGESENSGIYRMKADGTQLKKLSDDYVDYYDGYLFTTDTKLIYSSMDDEGEFNHYTMNLDGSEKTLIKAGDFYVRDIYGNQLIYAAYDYEAGTESLYKADVDFNNPVLIAENEEGQYIGIFSGNAWFYDYSLEELVGYPLQ